MGGLFYVPKNCFLLRGLKEIAEPIGLVSQAPTVRQQKV
jgi:hypothetical protein